MRTALARFVFSGIVPGHFIQQVRFALTSILEGAFLAMSKTSCQSARPSESQAGRHYSRLFVLLPAMGLLVNMLLLSSATGQSVAGAITHPGLAASGMAVYEKGNKLCVFDDRTNHLLIFDGASLSLDKEIIFQDYISDPFSCIGLVVDEKEGRLYACLGHENWPQKWAMVAIVDLVNDSPPLEIAINGLLPQSAVGIALDPETKKIFLWGFHTEVFVLDLTTNLVTRINMSATHLALNPVTHEVFIAAGTDIWILNGSTLQLSFGIKATGTQVYDMVVNYIENKLYLITVAPFITSIYDRDDGSMKQLDDLNDSMSLFFSPGSNHVYTSAEIACRSTVIDGKTDQWYYLPMEGGAPAMGFRHSTQHAYFVSTHFIAIFDETTQMMEKMAFNHPHAEMRSGEQLIAVNQTTGQIFVSSVSLYDPPDENPVWVLQDLEMMTRPNILLGGRDIAVLDPEDNGILNLWGVLAGTGFGFRTEGGTCRPDGGRAYFARRGSYGAAQISVHAGCGAADVNWMSAGDFEAIVGSHDMQGLDPITPVSSLDGRLLYVTCSSTNRVRILDVAVDSNLQVLNEIAVGKTPWGAALTPDGTRLYVTNKGSNTVSVIDALTQTVASTVPVGSQPWGLAINPSQSFAYAANSGSGTVSVIDLSTNQVSAAITVGSNPHWISFSPDGKLACITNNASGSVSVIDAGNHQVIQTISAGPHPEGLGFYPDGSRVYVATDSGVSVIPLADYRVDSFAEYDAPYYTITIPDPAARFAGRLTDQKGLPVVNALVRAMQDGVEKGRATPNTAGDFCITSLQSGQYDLELSGPGFPGEYVQAQTVNAGQTRIIHFNGPTGMKARGASPEQFSLSQNYPNPFNSSTLISYALPQEAQVRLAIFDALGRLVVTLLDEKQQAGCHEMIFRPANLTSGIYFCQLQAGAFTAIRKMLSIR